MSCNKQGKYELNGNFDKTNLNESGGLLVSSSQKGKAGFCATYGATRIAIVVVILLVVAAVIVIPVVLTKCCISSPSEGNLTQLTSIRPTPTRDRVTTLPSSITPNTTTVTHLPKTSEDDAMAKTQVSSEATTEGGQYRYSTPAIFSTDLLPEGSSTVTQTPAALTEDGEYTTYSGRTQTDKVLHITTEEVKEHASTAGEEMTSAPRQFSSDSFTHRVSSELDTSITPRAGVSGSTYDVTSDMIHEPTSHHTTEEDRVFTTSDTSAAPPDVLTSTQHTLKSTVESLNATTTMMPETSYSETNFTSYTTPDTHLSSERVQVTTSTSVSRVSTALVGSTDVRDEQTSRRAPITTSLPPSPTTEEEIPQTSALPQPTSPRLSTTSAVPPTTTPVLPTEETTAQFPYTSGVHLDVATWHASGRFREGQATDTHSCDHVREVPEELRDNDVQLARIHPNYTQYTEAYGIPVVGSNNVTATGLRRACFTVRFLLASRYDIRNIIYKLYVKVALIGDGEQQTDLPDYRGLDPDYWNNRARGLGATLAIPAASAGDDNQRCSEADHRYFNYDIFVHEFSHGVHNMGAIYAIPLFDVRLQALYDNAKNKSLFPRSYYMMNNRNEFFAEATQLYFGSYLKNDYRYNDTNGTQHQILGRSDLQKQDPDLVKLLDEVYSCQSNIDKFVQRCATVEDYPIRVVGKRPRRCTRTFMSQGISILQCVQVACRSNSRIWTFRQSERLCRVYDCPQENIDDVQFVNNLQDIVYMTPTPWKQNRTELQVELDQLCTRNNNTEEDCEVSEPDRAQCGPELQTRDQCMRRGCCYDADRDQCFYKKMTCYDEIGQCGNLAAVGDCNRNPGFMHRKCMFTCGLCETGSPYSDLTSLCQDKSAVCGAWTQSGFCTKYPAVRRDCPLSCGGCTPNWPGASVLAPSDLRAKAAGEPDGIIQ